MILPQWCPAQWSCLTSFPGPVINDPQLGPPVTDSVHQSFFTFKFFFCKFSFQTIYNCDKECPPHYRSKDPGQCLFCCSALWTLGPSQPRASPVDNPDQMSQLVSDLPWPSPEPGEQHPPSPPLYRPPHCIWLLTVVMMAAVTRSPVIMNSPAGLLLTSVSLLLLGELHSGPFPLNIFMMNTIEKDWT